MTAVTSPDSCVLNYIAEDDLRESLITDFREMEAASKAESWKCVLVLAGSIVEALLIDHLLAVKYGGKSEDDILRMELGGAIAACVTEKLLDDTTDKLCSVIRDYRNLIHPGRVKRLQKPVTQETAQIAMQLVKMVAREIAKRRREQYGYTAQEVMAKIECDGTAFPGILPALLKKLPESERKRLLFKLLPERNSEWRIQMGTVDDPEALAFYRKGVRCVSMCFRQLLRTADQETVKEVGKKYLRILHSGTELERRHYEYSFFRASDIITYPAAERETLVSHVFSIIENPTAESLACTEGLVTFLTNGGALAKQCGNLLRAAIHGHQVEIEEAVSWLRGLVSGMNQYVSRAFLSELDSQAQTASAVSDWRVVDRVRKIQMAFGRKPIPAAGDPIPF